MGRKSALIMTGEAALGRKGQETRRKLMDTAAVLLDAIPLRDIRAADISRKAGLSAGAFYVYFENVEAVALALAHRVAQESASLLKLLEENWHGPDADKQIRRFVRAYFRFWDEHRSTLRVRNLASEEGDKQFLEARLAMSVPLHQAVAAKIAQARAGHVANRQENPTALAAMIIGGVDRVASFAHHVEFREYAVTRGLLIEAGVQVVSAIIHHRSAQRPASDVRPPGAPVLDLPEPDR